MRAYTRLVSILRTLFRKKQLDDDLAQELSSYVELLADEKIRQGSSPEVAYRQARIELGGAVQVTERVRERRLGAAIDMLFQDLRFTFRTLRRDLAFAVVVVVTSGIGIGAATATFSAVSGVLLRPLPYARSGELVFLGSQFPGSARPAVTSVADFVDWEEQISTLEGVGAMLSTSLVVTTDGDSRRVPLARISPRYLRTLGVVPVLGREFTAREHSTSAGPVVLLSYSIWRNRWGGDPGVSGSGHSQSRWGERGPALSSNRGGPARWIQTTNAFLRCRARALGFASRRRRGPD